MAKNYPLSDHFNGKVFFDPHGMELKSFWDVMKWKWSAEPKKWPTHVPNKSYPFVPITAKNKGVVTFINHATFLIQLQGLTLLTDPQFADRASPFSFAGPKRVRSPGIELENLPPIDVVLVSHNHYDHLDIESLQKLDQKFHPLFVVPLGDEELLLKAGIQNVKEVDWWEQTILKGVTLTYAPAKHWSARGLYDKNKSLWGSFMISQNGFQVYFAGDTGLGPHFRQIKEKLGAPAIALLPIGAYEPRWFMKDAHMNPEDATQAHIDLGARKSIGMHFGTFQLTDEGIDDPVKKLEEARKAKSLSENDFAILGEGESLVY